MEKKTKLTVSGSAKKTIKNIEIAKTQGKNSIVIEKKSNKFPKKSNTSLTQLTKICEKITGNKIKFNKISKTSIYDIPYFITNNNLVTKTYGWRPKRNILKVVMDTFLWLKNNKSKINKYF